MSEVTERLLHLMDTLFFRDSKHSNHCIVPCYLIIRAIKSIKDDNLLELFNKDLESGIFERLTYPFYIDLEKHKITILGYSEKNQEFKVSVLKYKSEVQQEKTMKHIDKRLTIIDAEKHVHITHKLLPLFRNFTDDQLKRFQNKLISYDPQGMRSELFKGTREGSERIALTMLILGKKNLDAVFSSLVEFFHATRVATFSMTDEELVSFSNGPFSKICGTFKTDRNLTGFKNEFLAKKKTAVTNCQSTT
jgi:hypothetical protein